MNTGLSDTGGDAGYLEPYREAVRDHGPRFEALLWKNAEAQVARFRAAAEMVDLTGKVVADLGLRRTCRLNRNLSTLKSWLQMLLKKKQCRPSNRQRR